MNTLGPGFLEKVYENALIVELRRRGIECKPQEPIPVYYKGEEVGKYFVDVLSRENCSSN
jgi:GxxExxY protein